MAADRQYAASGVAFDPQSKGLGNLLRWVKGTFQNNPRAPVALDVGFYASVLDLKGMPIDLALSTDGVGTKILVAEMAGKHDTVGIDCVAMNANDLVCVGAEPLAMVDYLGVESVDPDTLDQIGKGLAEGARQAEISIPGGELAQLPEMIKGVHEGSGYDLVGSCVGVVEKGKTLDGRKVTPGDAVVGIRSTGVHSNGFSLARRVIFETMGKSVGDQLPECGRTVGEELLEPTAMYVREAKAILAGPAEAHAFLHVTGGGFTNLLRVARTDIGYHLDSLPEPHPIFSVIQQGGGVSDAEMHEVFNMGVGFVVVVPQSGADAVVAAAKEEGKEAQVIGRIVEDAARRVVIERDGIEGCLIGTATGVEAASALPEPHRS